MVIDVHQAMAIRPHAAQCFRCRSSSGDCLPRKVSIKTHQQLSESANNSHGFVLSITTAVAVSRRRFGPLRQGFQSAPPAAGVPDAKAPERRSCFCSSPLAICEISIPAYTAAQYRMDRFPPFPCRFQPVHRSGCFFPGVATDKVSHCPTVRICFLR